MAFYECTDSSAVILSDLPAAPGVYIFRDDGGKILYVGKAGNLRKRLASYFGKRSGVAAKTAIMLQHARTFEVLVAPTEKEALILEATLIKKHRPRYNIVFRDDKAYPFLRISTGDPFPRFSIVRKRKRDRAEYFGPYPSSGALRDTVRLLTSTFGIRTCTTRAMKNRRRACLQFQMGRCSGPCVNAVSHEEYMEQVRQVLDFLTGRSSALMRKLREEMDRAAEMLDFEKAAILRDRMAALRKILEKQSVVSGIDASWDCIGMAVEGGDISVAVLRVREGMVSGCEARQISLEHAENHASLLHAFIAGFYQDTVPAREVLVPVLPDAADMLAQWFSEMWGYGIRISIPARGDRKRLMDMAIENASRNAAQLRTRRGRWDVLAADITRKLRLACLPSRMECVDISTTAGELSSGSLVAFLHGVPWKQGYRIYNIRDIEGVDDYAMIYQVVMRRMKRAAQKDDMPDLLLIDGGRGQFSMALQAVKDAGIVSGPALVAIAKERDGQGERLYLPGESQPLRLERHDPVLLFMQRMRDEAHRFGITAHRKRRDKKRAVSTLSDIPGIGPARQGLLLQTFGSVDRIRNISLQDLKAVKGLPAHVAERIYRFLHEHNT